MLFFIIMIFLTTTLDKNTGISIFGVYFFHTCNSVSAINVSSCSVTWLQEHAVIAHMLQCDWTICGRYLKSHNAAFQSQAQTSSCSAPCSTLWNKLLKIAVLHIVLGLFWREPCLCMLVFHGPRCFNHLCTVTRRALHLDSFLFCIKGLDTNTRCHLLRPTNQKQRWGDERTGLHLLWALQDFTAQWRTGCRSTADTVHSSL